MLKQFKEIIKQFDAKPNITYYLAVSGGVDSMVLTHLMMKTKLPFKILHCNFQLRGEESNEDEAFIISFATQNEIPLLVKKFDTEKIAKEKKQTIQVCARDLRYNWFFEEIKKDKNGILVTAHHLNDSIETFFINTLRGTGLKGLKGISSSKIYRPLLNFKKNDILAFAQENKILYREDSSNLSDKYLRNKIRQKIIPSFIEIEPSFEEKMHLLLHEMDEINQYLEANFIDFKQKHFIYEKEYKKIPIEKLIDLPNFYVSGIFSEFGLNRKKVKEFIHFSMSSTGSIFKTETHLFLKNRNEILIKINGLEKNDEMIEVDTIPFSINFQDKNIHFSIQKNKIPFSNEIANLDYEKIKLPLIIRKWGKGDKIQPLGMKGKKLISDILNDTKTNLFDKENQWVLEQNGEIIWLIGKTISEKFKLSEKTKDVLVVKIG